MKRKRARKKELESAEEEDKSELGELDRLLPIGLMDDPPTLLDIVRTSPKRRRVAPLSFSFSPAPVRTMQPPLPLEAYETHRANFRQVASVLSDLVAQRIVREDVVERGLREIVDCFSENVYGMHMARFARVWVEEKKEPDGTALLSFQPQLVSVKLLLTDAEADSMRGAAERGEDVSVAWIRPRAVGVFPPDLPANIAVGRESLCMREETWVVLFMEPVRN